MNNATSSARTQAILSLKMIQHVERVQLAVRQAPGSKDPDILVLITGQLEPMLRQIITQLGSEKAMASREISPNVLLFGKAAQVELAARRMMGAPLTGAPDSLSESDIWISGDTVLMNSMGEKRFGHAKDWTL